jgi:hypothetical protein
MSDSKIKELEKKIFEYKTILTHLVPDFSGQYFICGSVGEEDVYGLPKMILVCPEMGLEGFAVYTKTADYRAPGW